MMDDVLAIQAESCWSGVGRRSVGRVNKNHIISHVLTWKDFHEDDDGYDRACISNSN